MKRYLIEGSTGEWEDTITWYVSLNGKTLLFLDEAEAIILCNNLNDLVGGITTDDLEHNYLILDIRRMLDENCIVNYPGTYYTIEEFNFEEIK